MERIKNMSKIVMALMILLLLAPLTSAELVFKQHDIIDLKRACIDAGKFCDTNYACNITISKPDGTLLKDNQVMTHSSSYYNITIVPPVLGKYSAIMSCNNITDAGADTFTFDVTPSGNKGYATYYFIIILLSYGVFSLGIWKRDITISLLGSFALFFVGIWVMFFGIDVFKNYLTEGFAIITLGIASYSSVRMAYDYIVD